SRIEEGSERSYSIDTIEKLEHHDRPGFLIGSDAFAEIRTWHRWRDVVDAVEFIVVPRPGAAYSVPPGARVTEVPGVSLEESSSAVRSQIAEGRDDVPVPPGVLAYIRAHSLYGSGDL